MGWLTRLATKIVAKEMGVDPGTFISSVNGGGASRFSSKKTNTRALLEAYSTSPWYQGVIERISFAAAVVPWRLYSVKPSRGSREELAGRHFVKHTPFQTGEDLATRQKIADELERDDRLVEVTDHKLFDVLSEPNGAMTGVDMRQVTFASLQVVGEIGWALARNGLGAPEQIWPVPAHWIKGVPRDGHDYYEVQIGQRTTRFARDEFIMFSNPRLENPYGRGVGLGTALADELETDEYMARFQKTWFVTRGKPDLVISVKPSAGGGTPQRDALAEAKERFENDYRDVRRSGRSFWVRGDVDIKELGQKMVDLEMTEQRSWIKDLVRQVHGVPPEIMGDIQNSNRATIEQALAILAILSTVPQLERMRAQLQMKLIPLFDERLVLGYHSPVPEDREFKLKAIQAAPYTVEVGELRRLQGFDARGEADRVHWIPTGLMPMPAPSDGDPQPTFDDPEPEPEPEEAPPEDGGDDGSDEGGDDTPADDAPAEEAPKSIKMVRKVTDEDIDRLSASLTPQSFEQEVLPEVAKTVEIWGTAAAAELGVAGTFNMVNPEVLNHLAEFSGTRISGINNTTIKLVREQLRQGVASGEGTPMLARRLEKTMSGMSKTRSLTIARTEVTRSANFGSWYASEVSGLVPKKAWVATADAKTRHAHQVLDGQVVGISDPFEFNGSHALYPGEFGQAGLDINCRCTWRGIFPERKDWNRIEFVRNFLAKTDDDEARVARAVKRAFRKQTDAMLRLLARMR